MASANYVRSPPTEEADQGQEIRISGLELEGTGASEMQNLQGTVGGGHGGVFVTWEDLWVTVPDGRTKKRRSILGVTGYARPGELLAIMGPSGSAYLGLQDKSTLLDALAGRLDPKTTLSGDILINGRRQQLAYGTSAYVTQDDAFITTLTVREAVYYSAQLQLPSSMSKSQKRERAEMVIKEFGLQDAMNTRIGGWGAKGLSGGQKRRVSICIEILTRPKLLFLDEPTSGLDSAAAYYVMSRIARQREGKTIVTSIHQPSSEVFGLFQNVCLLSSGKTVYFGPAHAANEIGQNPSDHFLNSINKDLDEDIEEGLSMKLHTEEAIRILINSYRSSESFKDVQKLVSEICLNGNRENVNFMVRCFVLTKRSSINMFREIGYYWMRLFVYILIALGLGTIFYHVTDPSPSSVQATGSILIFVSLFLTFMAIGGFPSFVEDMKVFQRERLNGHYDPSAFVIGNLLSAFPFLLLVSLIPGAIAFFLTGFQNGLEPGKVIDHFFYFVLFACMILVESLMMVIASLVPNFLTGIILGAGIQGLMVLTGGFFRLPDDLPKPVWKYPLHYVAFHTYAFQGLLKNEFLDQTYPNFFEGIPSRISGEVVLKNSFQIKVDHSKWVDLAILFGMVIMYRVLFFIIVRAGEKIKLAIEAASMQVQQNKAVQIVGAETTSARNSPLI